MSTNKISQRNSSLNFLLTWSAALCTVPELLDNRYYSYKNGAGTGNETNHHFFLQCKQPVRAALTCSMHFHSYITANKSKKRRKRRKRRREQAEEMRNETETDRGRKKESKVSGVHLELTSAKDIHFPF